MPAIVPVPVSVPPKAEEDDFCTQEEEKEKLALSFAKRTEIMKERGKKPMTPGPGANNLPTMFGGRIEDKFGRCVNKPSPTVRASPAFSFVGRRDEQSEEVVADVGPGRYNLNLEAVRKRPQGCVFGSQERMRGRTRMETPGAGLVSAENDPRYARSPRFGFGSIDRTKTGIGAGKPVARGCKMPGPGELSPSDIATSKNPAGPTYSFGIRSPHEPETTATKKEMHSPGPLTYDSLPGEAWTVPATPRCCFGTTPRMAEKFKVTPGPGAYSNLSSTRTGQGTGTKWSMTGKGKDSCIDGRTY